MKKDHYHIYKRINLSKAGKHIVYRCMKPDCSHFLREELVVNRIAECPRCHNPFKLTKALMHKKVNPHCPDCTQRKVKVDNEKVNSLLEKLLGGGT